MFFLEAEALVSYYLSIYFEVLITITKGIFSNK